MRPELSYNCPITMYRINKVIFIFVRLAPILAFTEPYSISLRSGRIINFDRSKIDVVEGTLNLFEDSNSPLSWSPQREK